MNSHSPDALLDQVSRFVADTHVLLEQGALIEMNQFDQQVRQLCDAVLALSQDDRVLYADRLQALLAELKNLGDAMIAQKDMLAREIQQLSQHRKASVAYRTTDMSNPPDKKNESK